MQSTLTEKKNPVTLMLEAALYSKTSELIQYSVR